MDISTTITLMVVSFLLAILLCANVGDFEKEAKRN